MFCLRGFKLADLDVVLLEVEMHVYYEFCTLRIGNETPSLDRMINRGEAARQPFNGFMKVLTRKTDAHLATVPPYLLPPPTSLRSRLLSVRTIPGFVLSTHVYQRDINSWFNRVTGSPTPECRRSRCPRNFVTWIPEVSIYQPGDCGHESSPHAP